MTAHSDRPPPTDPDEPVVLINVFEVAAEHAEAFVEQWTETADLLRAKPGFIDTALHRASAPGSRFQFINVAHWRRAGQFQAAISSPEVQEQLRTGGVPLVAHPALYQVAASLSGPR
ncbi:MAG TPA: antibiotic biosynthesis monooxygenase family protein [Pseudonocardia sp.]|jgi:heme-degrading monooxygenase HmoA